MKCNLSYILESKQELLKFHKFLLLLNITFRMCRCHDVIFHAFCPSKIYTFQNVDGHNVLASHSSFVVLGLQYGKKISFGLLSKKGTNKRYFIANKGGWMRKTVSKLLKFFHDQLRDLFSKLKNSEYRISRPPLFLSTKKTFDILRSIPYKCASFQNSLRRLFH